MSDASSTYTRRQFVGYQHLVDGGHADQAEDAVAAYAGRHPDRDLDEKITFAQWLSEEQGTDRFAPA